MDTQCSSIGLVLQRLGGLQLNRKISSYSEKAWVSSGGQCMNSSSYLACCLQRGRKGQWTMQPEELLDKLKEEKQTNKQKKIMILQLNKKNMECQRIKNTEHHA